MKLRIAVVALALLLMAVVLVISRRQEAPNGDIVVDSGSEAELSATSSEPRLPEAEAVPEPAAPAEFGITEDEFDEFKKTLLRSLNEQFRASIDSDVKSSWDTPAPAGNESKLEEPRPSQGDRN